MDKKLETILNSRTHSGREEKPYKPFFTYRQILECLKNAPDEILDQQAQIMPPHNTPSPVRLMPVIAIDTVKELLHVGDEITLETRSTLDFKHHPEQLILMADYCSFGAKGDSFYTMVGDKLIGDVSGEDAMAKLRNPGKEEL